MVPKTVPNTPHTQLPPDTPAAVKTTPDTPRHPSSSQDTPKPVMTCCSLMGLLSGRVLVGGVLWFPWGSGGSLGVSQGYPWGDAVTPQTPRFPQQPPRAPQRSLPRPPPLTPHERSGLGQVGRTGGRDSAFTWPAYSNRAPAGTPSGNRPRAHHIPPSFVRPHYRPRREGWDYRLG